MTEQITPFPTVDLLLWYDGARRPLPWRGSHDPYTIWISEVMCQQTRVATVEGYFARWMDAFPTVHSLANASEDDVFRLWQGLGYYSRARNLLRAARQVVDDHAGVFPTNAADLRSLPGIGRYTAAAIASIAYDEPIGVVDGNVLRVLARYYAIHDDIRLAKNLEQFWRLSDDAVHPHTPGDSNQALMELGATVCTPRSPACDACPLSATCVATRDGLAASLPYKSPKKPARHEHRFAYRIERADGSMLLARNPSGSLLGGMWQFPMVPATEDPETAFASATGSALENVVTYPPIRHVFSHIRMDVTLVTAKLPHVATFSSYAELNWMTPNQLAGVGTSKLMKKLVEHHDQMEPLPQSSG